jgi:MoxR-like ATPase
MSKIRFDSEQELVEGIKQSQVYEEFTTKYLGHKLEREKETWRLLTEHRGRYTKQILGRMFDTVDLAPDNTRWFGLLLLGQNRKLILDSEPSLINRWFEELLFSGQEPSVSLNACMKQLKIQGASNGLATLSLYLSNPNKWTIWLPATERGLVILGRIERFKGQDWGRYYTTKFNVQAMDFWLKHGLKPQETDWFLNHISSCVKSEEGHFLVDINRKGCGGPQPPKRYWRITLPDQTEATLPNGEKIVLDIWKPCRDHGIAAIGFGDNREHPQVKKFMSILPGDCIVAFLRNKTIGGIGTVTWSFDEDLFTQRSAEQDYWRGFFWFRLGVEWRAGQKSVDKLSEKVRNKFGQQTIVELSQAEYDAVAKLFDDGPVPSFDGATFLARTYLRDEQADDLYDMLLDKKQIILYGPPGTGKTYVAQELAKWITGLTTPPADRVEMIQFHPAYSYEDFIEGIRPESKQTGDGHFTVDYPPRPGVFRRFCKIAQENSAQEHVFIIDEINRGNIPRIFGELMLLLEYRDRDVPLPYSCERFRIPPNVYLIGTMNTADRSIALVDFALRRRFHFFQFSADPDLYERWLAEHPVSIPYLAKLYRRLSQEAIDDPDYAVGVSYFMDPGLTEAKLARIWRRSIVPYLAEYHVEQRARIEKWQWNSDFMAGIRGEA